MAQYVIHPLANLLPMIPDAELKEMAEDIKKNGQRFSIVRWHGQIIDGRNRLRACEMAGVPPVIKDKDNELADEDAVSNFILTANFVRRHLEVSQRAALAAELVDTFEKIRAAEAQKAVSNSGKTDGAEPVEPPPTGTEQAPDEESDEDEDDGEAEGEEDSPEETEESPKAPRDKTKRVKEAAEKMHTSPAYVHEAGRLKRDAPEKYEEVKEGKKTLSRAKKELQDEKGKPEISDAKKLAKAEKLVEKCQEKLEELGYSLVQTKIAPL